MKVIQLQEFLEIVTIYLCIPTHYVNYCKRMLAMSRMECTLTPFPKWKHLCAMTKHFSKFDTSKPMPTYVNTLEWWLVQPYFKRGTSSTCKQSPHSGWPAICQYWAQTTILHVLHWEVWHVFRCSFTVDSDQKTMEWMQHKNFPDAPVYPQCILLCL